MILLQLFLLAGHALASSTATKATPKYSPKTDPSIAPLLRNIPGEVDRLEVFAEVLNERKSLGESISPEFLTEFEKLKAKRTAELATGQVIPSPRVPPAITAANSAQPLTAIGPKYIPQPAPRPVSQQIPRPAIRDVQPRHQNGTTIPPLALQNLNSRPQASAPQPVPLPQSQLSLPSLSQPGGIRDPEEAFMLANFTEKLIQRVYRFERDRRRKMRGAAVTPANPAAVASPRVPPRHVIIGESQSVTKRKPATPKQAPVTSPKQVPVASPPTLPPNTARPIQAFSPRRVNKNGIPVVKAATTQATPPPSPTKQVSQPAKTKSSVPVKPKPKAVKKNNKGDKGKDAEVVKPPTSPTPDQEETTEEGAQE